MYPQSTSHVVLFQRFPQGLEPDNHGEDNLWVELMQYAEGRISEIVTSFPTLKTVTRDLGVV